MNNKIEESEQAFGEVEMFIGIETSPDNDSCPSICVEFNISPRVFAIAFALNILEKKRNCNEEDREKETDM